MLYLLNHWPKAAEDFLKDWDNIDNHIFTFHTSGTTGPSKTISLSREQILAAAVSSEGPIGWSRGQRMGIALNTAGIGGKMALVRSRCYNMTIFPLEIRLNNRPPNSEQMKQEAWTEFIDHLSLVPVQALALLRYWAQNKVDPSTRVGTLLLGGGAVPADLEHFLKVDCPWNPLNGASHFRILQGLGMTETAGHFALRTLYPRFETAYTAVPGIQLCVDHDGFDPTLHQGRLIITGPVTNHQPLATREIVRPGPQPNQVEWLGREDLVIQSGGHTLLIDEIEIRIRSALHEQHRPKALESWDFMAQIQWYLAPLADPVWGERVTLCIPVPQFDALSTSGKIYALKPMDWSIYLPSTCWPRAIAPVPPDCFPESGKILRRSPPLAGYPEPVVLG